MCAVMVFAVVDKADTVVMNDKEELDSWSVIINGAVRVEGGEGGRTHTLSLGQGFGIKPTTQKVQKTHLCDCLNRVFSCFSYPHQCCGPGSRIQGSNAFLTPKYGIRIRDRKKSGSGINIPDHIPREHSITFLG